MIPVRRLQRALLVCAIALVVVCGLCRDAGAALEVLSPTEKPPPAGIDRSVAAEPPAAPDREPVHQSMAATARLLPKPSPPAGVPSPPGEERQPEAEAEVNGTARPTVPVDPAGSPDLLPIPDISPVPGLSEETALAARPDRPESPAAPHLRIAFGAGSADLAEGSALALDRIARRLEADETLRVQVVAYAAGEDLTPSTARRLSLARALAVRGHLIDRGIAGTRMDVRALGDQVEDEPFNRVDLSVARR